ncbi:biotin synthase BioB [Synechococcus sp. AH-707-B22]|nr:biotin synthase BioB [Synechococcus sp. AH-707-B22]
MTEAVEVRHDWTRSEIEALLDLPLMDLLWRAQGVHRATNPGYHVQLASLLSVKTGGCEEDCAYCPQSMHHSSDVTGQPELQVAPVLERAKAAKQAGADRFCMGWAWREIREGAPFEAMLQMVSGVRALGMEACVTAGMLTDDQAKRLAEAGLTAYNHNLDTSPEHYDKIITTRTFQERLETLERVRQAGVTLCCGGIIGMGETVKDRASMLQVLASINPHPESVPINALVAVEGTPLEELKQYFRPEFLNRLDEIIVFRQLNREEVKDIAEIMLKEVFARIGDKGITLTVSNAFKERLVEEGYNPAYGARPLRRAVMRLLEDSLAEEVLTGRIKEGDSAEVDIDHDKKVVVRHLNTSTPVTPQLANAGV